jgi:pyruvate carboxylase
LVLRSNQKLIEYLTADVSADIRQAITEVIFALAKAGRYLNAEMVGFPVDKP